MKKTKINSAELLPSNQPSPELLRSDYPSKERKNSDSISEITSDSQHNVVLDWSVGFCTLDLQSTAPPTAKIGSAPPPMTSRRCFPPTPVIPVKACQYPCERGLLGFVNHYRWTILFLTLVLIIFIARTHVILQLTCRNTTGITTGCWSLDRRSRCVWYRYFPCL